MRFFHIPKFKKKFKNPKMPNDGIFLVREKWHMSEITE